MSKYDSYDSPARPDPNCRSCTDFKTWSRQQRKQSQSTANKNSSDAQQKKDIQEQVPPKDCPLDKDSLGRGTWGLLHTIGAVYPDHPTESEQRDVRTFFDTFSRLYPCEPCAQGIQADLKTHPVQAASQVELSQWLCRFHNRVNEKLGKPLFDCTKVDERWRDGWKDGSCD